MVCHRSLKSAGAILKSWKAVSGVRAPTEPSAGGEVKNADQLTDEQRQLLAQMQADMRQQPTQLNEVPWNEQTPAQRQQTLQLQRQRQAQIQQQQQQQWTQNQPVQQPKAQPRVTEQPYQQPQTRTAQSQPAQQPKAQTQKQTAQPYQDLLQTPAHTTAQQPKTQQAAPVTKETEAPKQTAEKKDERRWMVQCGSFKGAEQAETVRAQLAFEGFDSRITTNNGWNRVVIGPVKGKENADGTISRLKVAGHTNCIRLASGVETPNSPSIFLFSPEHRLRASVSRFCNRGLLVTTIVSVRRNGHVVIAGDGRHAG